MERRTICSNSPRTASFVCSTMWKIRQTCSKVSDPSSSFEGWTSSVFLEAALLLISPGQDGTRVRPHDADVRIVPGNATLGVGSVVPRLLVLDFAVLGNRRKPMREADRHVDEPLVFGRELDRKPLAEGR